jgi:hypothetical protein
MMLVVICIRRQCAGSRQTQDHREWEPNLPIAHTISLSGFAHPYPSGCGRTLIQVSSG